MLRPHWGRGGALECPLVLLPVVDAFPIIYKDYCLTRLYRFNSLFPRLGLGKYTEAAASFDAARCAPLLILFPSLSLYRYLLLPLPLTLPLLLRVSLSLSLCLSLSLSARLLLLQRCRCTCMLLSHLLCSLRTVCHCSELTSHVINVRVRVCGLQGIGSGECNRR